MIGKSISYYRVTAKLGAGGMGEVYRATDTKLEGEVALKVLPPVFANDSQRMARFEREAVNIVLNWFDEVRRRAELTTVLFPLKCSSDSRRSAALPGKHGTGQGGMNVPG